MKIKLMSDLMNSDGKNFPILTVLEAEYNKQENVFIAEYDDENYGEEKRELHIPISQARILFEKKQKIDIVNYLNNLDVYYSEFGEDEAVLVKLNETILSDLEELGLPRKIVESFGDDQETCILSLSYSSGLADRYENGKLVIENMEETKNV